MRCEGSRHQCEIQTLDQRDNCAHQPQLQFVHGQTAALLYQLARDVSTVKQDLAALENSHKCKHASLQMRIDALELQLKDRAAKQVHGQGPLNVAHCDVQLDFRDPAAAAINRGLHLVWTMQNAQVENQERAQGSQQVVTKSPAAVTGLVGDKQADDVAAAIARLDQFHLRLAEEGFSVMRDQIELVKENLEALQRMLISENRRIWQALDNHTHDLTTEVVTQGPSSPPAQWGSTLCGCLGTATPSVPGQLPIMGASTVLPLQCQLQRARPDTFVQCEAVPSTSVPLRAVAPAPLRPLGPGSGVAQVPLLHGNASATTSAFSIPGIVSPSSFGSASPEFSLGIPQTMRQPIVFAAQPLTSQ